MAKIALFRYHHELEVCKNRLQLFAHYNPGVPVYGLYGGRPQDFDRYSRELVQLRGNYCITGLDDDRKWRCFDLALKEWYLNVGRAIPFRQLYLLEWDFVLFDSIESAYAHLPDGWAGFSGLTEIRNISGQWWWTRGPERDAELNQLLRHARANYGYDATPYGMLCPGLTLPRRFLDGMASIELPDVGNDELRLPLVAQLLGIGMRDTGFHKDWFSRWERRYFNCNGLDIAERRIIGQLLREHGRRAFHPYRGLFDTSRIPRRRSIEGLVGLALGVV